VYRPIRCPLAASLLLSLLAICAPAALAQQAEATGASMKDPARGFVWTPPNDLQQAQRDLQRMKKIGAQAVRTTLIQREPLLTLADTIGLQFYQELPLSYMAARHLRDTLAYARKLLDRALQRAQGHPSARRFGLARRSETSDTLACAYFRRLAERVRRRGPPGSQAYYLTAFPDTDRCAGAVDFVLLDALNASGGPVSLLRRWYAPADTTTPRPPAGLGAVGTRRVANAESGLRQPGSPEQQARYLEAALSTLLADTLRPKPLAVFVYRWNDAAASSSELNPAYGLAGPERYNYGLLGPDGAAHPAFDVARGFFSGGQTTFAFAAGASPDLPWPWLIFMAWGVVLLLGLAFAYSRLFQRMVPRYFRARSFYREAVREGRASMVGLSLLLLIVVSLSLGVFGSAALRLISEQNAFVVLVHRLPFVTPEFVTSLLPYPWLLALVLAGFTAAGLAVWAVFLAVLSLRHYALNPGQTLILALGPRWGYLVLMTGALVIVTFSHRTALFGMAALTALWVLIVLWGTLRTANDFRRAAQAPAWLGGLAALVSPLALLAMAAVMLASADWSGAEFLWHLAARSP